MEKIRQPLEQLKLNYYDQHKGELEELHALDKKFCRGVKFVKYRVAPSILPEVDPSVWQDWIEELMSLGNNLTWLLKLPHAEFWCEVVNNFSLQTCLDSYLQKAPRFRPSSWSDEVLEKHNALHKLVFITFIRMASHKESTSCFITPQCFGVLIYENYLFDIPKIMDLCTLYYNDTNRTILRKAVSNLFKHQPGYNDDLENTVTTIMEILKNIDRKCGTEICSDNDTESSTRRPHRLSVGHSSDSILLDMPLKDFRDIISYVSDTLHTLKCFMVNVYPAACSLFCKKYFVMYLASFYSSTLPKFSNALRARPLEDLNLKAQLVARMKICRTSLLSVAREILNECMLQPALNAATAGDHTGAMTFADKYLQMLLDLSEENKFYSEFTRKTPLLSDVQSLVQTCPGIDETRAEYILGPLGDGSTPRRQKEFPGKIITTELDRAYNAGGAMAKSEATTHGINRVELSSLISSVHDVLPDLGEGYIESCLLYFDKDCERTIHALLEGNLPDDLRAMDRTTPLSTSSDAAVARGYQENEYPTSLPDQDPTTDILRERQNKFDQDEFDIFHNPNMDFSRVHIGKMNKSILNDELEMTPELRQRYEEYSSISNEREVNRLRGSVTLNKEEEDIYNDEYDDMYDGLGVDANDADDTDELLARRPFGTPRVFTQGRKEKVLLSSSESDSEEERNKKKPDRFIVNPAEVRAKQEERRRQQQELRNQKKNRGKQNSDKAGDKPSDNPNRDRRRKDINKSRMANHNRKKMAIKKTSKGMGPV